MRQAISEYIYIIFNQYKCDKRNDYSQFIIDYFIHYVIQEYHSIFILVRQPVLNFNALCFSSFASRNP
jgi:hypothetical protein